MMMNKLLVVLSTLILTTAAFAQERIVELSTNARVIQEYGQQNFDRAPNSQNQFWVFEPYNTLPFFDDFSRRKVADYNPDHYPASAKSDTIWHSYRINGFLPAFENLYFMFDTSYTFTFNSSNNTVSKVANSPFQISFYENKLAPNNVTLTKTYWPIYDSISFNTTTQQPDTFFIAPDTLLTYKFDTLYYIKIASGSINWKNSNVFWNDTYPIKPPTIGVVTFDGLDSTGYPYNFNLATAHGKADVLNSVPFDLSGYTPDNDSLYFSFFYQSTGLGNQPEPMDSITLSFKAKDGTWKRVWSKNGYTLGTDGLFSRKVIAIKDTSFYHKNFEFRFTNYATLSGNLDHWHIDYVRIDIDADTTIKDIAWMSPGKSLFSKLQEIPYRQYTGTSADFFKNDVKNLFNQTINASYRLRVKDYFDNLLFSVDVNNVDFAAQAINSCTFCSQILNPLVGGSFSLPTTSNCARYEVQNIIQNIATEPNLLNDTMYYTQIMGDCFAYDDGSAEAAYGVTTAFAQMAQKYNAPNSDTLKSIRIYFNPVVVNSALVNQFTIVIWAEDGDGKPGNELHRNATPFAPQYINGINGFVDYKLDAVLIVSGNFFIGIEQLNASELNVGLDRNTNTMDMNFYRTTSNWYNSQYEGSWMMRPVFGACQDFVSGIPQNNTTAQNSFDLIPNPASNRVQLATTIEGNFDLIISNALGQQIVTGSYQNNDVINTENWNYGIYFLQIYQAQNGILLSKKLVISN